MFWGRGWGWCWAASFCSGIIRWIGNRNTTTVIRRDRCCRLSLHGLQKSVLIFNEKFTNTRRAHWPLFIRFFSLAELFHLSRRRQIWCNQAQTTTSKDLFYATSLNQLSGKYKSNLFGRKEKLFSYRLKQKIFECFFPDKSRQSNNMLEIKKGGQMYKFSTRLLMTESSVRNICAPKMSHFYYNWVETRGQFIW